jgi:hypothetical protein
VRHQQHHVAGFKVFPVLTREILSKKSSEQ